MSNIPNTHTIFFFYSRDTKISLLLKNISLLNNAKYKATKVNADKMQKMILEYREQLETLKEESLKEAGFTKKGSKLIPPKK